MNYIRFNSIMKMIVKFNTLDLKLKYTYYVIVLNNRVMQYKFYL